MYTRVWTVRPLALSVKAATLARASWSMQIASSRSPVSDVILPNARMRSTSDTRRVLWSCAIDAYSWILSGEPKLPSRRVSDTSDRTDSGVFSWC